jgi:Fur family ferric uptake transcriptional regulator
MARKKSESQEPRQPARAAAARSVLVDHLARQGLRHSATRDVVVDAFLASTSHVSAEELTARVRTLDPGIGQATVYRTLKLLEGCGIAAARQFGDGVTRYEPVLQRAHHDHLICTVCGAIVEFESPEIERLQLDVARAHRFVVDSHRLELYGRCAPCRSAAAPREVQ